MSSGIHSKTAETRDGSEPSSARLITTLSLAGLLSGLVLVSVYEATLPRILANQAEALREAVFKVLPGVERFQEMAYVGDNLQPTAEGEDAEEVVYAGYDSTDKLVGYAIPGQGPGFQDTISLIYGYQPDKRLIIGMEVLESRETPGLGDKIIKDKAFTQTFLELSVEPEIVPVTPGSKSAANEIDTITGATISSKAVVKIINTSNDRWLSRLSESEGDAPDPEKPHKQPERDVPPDQERQQEKR